MLERIIEPREYLPDDRKRFNNAALKAMIIPLLIEQLLQMVVGLADTMMVSYAGEAVVAGVGLDTMVYTIFIYLFTAISAGGSVVVSQYIGSKEKDNADLSASQIFFIGGALSLLCMVMMLFFGSSLLQTMYPKAEADTLEACKIYMWIVAWSFPANAVYNAGAAVFRAMGQTRVTMWVSFVANLVNVVGNAIGIFVLKAGAAGVAWPTTISWYVAAVIMTSLCIETKASDDLLKKIKAMSNPRISIKIRDSLRLDTPMAGRILGVAIPNSIENTLFQAAKVVLGMLTATFGTSQIAANTTGQTFWSLAACMGMSMGTVFITVVGQCVGAGDYEAAKWNIKKLTRLSLLLALIWNVIVMALTPILLTLYNLSDETKRLILIIVAIHNLFSALVQPFSGPLSSGLRAAGDVKFTMWASIFATVVCRTALSFILALWMGMGVIGIALAMVLDWCIKAALDIWRFRSGKWRDRKII
ncbi:MATE family efflux transporter [Butyrivibrio sp. FC2001]|uniref:MATE family efflux transporter n=1 Tax=Butyrivibrio sp. FC2001 TaxID=1280671 RepID=UPI000412BE86|nr:MATE family efflux transporter [Butyrivibrio sp. FC2001]